MERDNSRGLACCRGHQMGIEKTDFPRKLAPAFHAEQLPQCYSARDTAGINSETERKEYCHVSKMPEPDTNLLIQAVSFSSPLLLTAFSSDLIFFFSLFITHSSHF